MKQYTEYHLHCPDTTQGHQLHYRQWGNSDNPHVLFCVHGLTRNSHDFDALASELSQYYRVICPDIPGRGSSDWLDTPKDYNYTVYVNDMLLLLQHLQLSKVDWLGTSMGGLIGMMLAAQERSPINRLVMNDVGAFLPQAALQRIATYLHQKPPYFDDLATAETYFRNIHAPFGQLSDAQWQYLTQHSTCLQNDGTYHLHYDPNIRQSFQNNIEDVVLWSVWEKVQCPVLLLHGVESDLLSSDTIQHMQQTHNDLQVVHIENTGHAPALMDKEQIQYIQKFLGV